MADNPNKPDKTNKLKARLPRGLADRGPAEIAATRRMLDTIRGVYERYGFEPVETPMLEYTDALGKFLPDQDRPNEGVFSLQDDDEQWLSLRYDLTAPLARYVAENFQNLALPYRSYRAGWVFRNEKPGPGRFRQFMQFDADTVGSRSPAADAEMCMMAADTMEALGIPRGSYLVKVNTRKLLDGLLESINLAGEQNAERRLIVLRAIDKVDRLGVQGVHDLLGNGRWDGGAEGVGDFTKGAGLDLGSIQKVIVWLSFEDFFRKSQTGEVGFGMPNPYYVPPLSWPDIHSTMRPGITEFNIANRERSHSNNWDRLGALAIALYDTPQVLVEGFAELELIVDLVEQAGYGDCVRIDPSVVRGLEYYTGPVYEVELTFESKDDTGRPVRFGSVGGGGRYDGLVSRFRGEPVPATGFSIGVSRLLAALQHLGKIETRPEPGPVVVTVFDRDRIADYQSMVKSLRDAGIRAELYLGNPKNTGNQFKYADKRNSPCVVIQGSNEKQKGEVQIKDLALGAQLAGLSKEREDYLQKQAAAQFAVPEDRLVETVHELLARQSESSLTEPAVRADKDLGRVPLQVKIIHLRYCRVVCSEDSFVVNFDGQQHRITFRDPRFAHQKGYVVERIDGSFVSSNFLLWMSVYTGEDALDPFQEIDSRFVWQRGDFLVDRSGLQKFLTSAERVGKRKWAKWKQELFDNAVIYFSGAVRAGVNMMPVNLGLFALSLECLGNVKYGSRDKHFTFGERQFKRLLTERLAPLKKDSSKKADVRSFERRLEADIDILNRLRNAFYGHSLLHMTDDREKLVRDLRKWSIRNGHSKESAEMSFRTDRVQQDVARESFALYKLGLRLNRLFLFLALGFSGSIPFATHDWHALGDHREGEEYEHRGVRITTSISTVQN